MIIEADCGSNRRRALRFVFLLCCAAQGCDLPTPAPLSIEHSRSEPETRDDGRVEVLQVESERAEADTASLAAHRTPAAPSRPSNLITYTVHGPFERMERVRFAEPGNALVRPVGITAIFRRRASPLDSCETGWLKVEFFYASTTPGADRISVHLTAYDQRGERIVDETTRTEDRRLWIESEPPMISGAVYHVVPINTVLVPVEDSALTSIDRVRVEFSKD
jgi:hypothetical protein